MTKGSRAVHPISALRDTGVLWAINRVLFHPRGFALAVVQESDGTVSGWTMQGDGSEVWTFSEADDDESFKAFASFLASLKAVEPTR